MSRADSLRRARIKRMKRRRRFLTAAGLIAAAVIIAAAAALYVRYAPTRERMDAEEYFINRMNAAMEEAGGTETERRTQLLPDELAIVMEDTVCVSPARMVEGSLYLPCDIVRSGLSSRFFPDEENNQLLYTTADETLVIPFNEKTYAAGGESIVREKPAVISDERGIFIDADFAAEFTGAEFLTMEESRHVLVHCRSGRQLRAAAKRDTHVRYRGGIKSPILTDLAKGDEVLVLESLEDWMQVVSPDGFIGYVPSRSLTEPEEKEVVRESGQASYPSISLEGGVSLVWHMVYDGSVNNRLLSDTAGMTGVNVISPTWFSVTGEDGSISSLASGTYVRYAHKQGLQVWGLVSNFEQGVSTSALLASTAARRNLADNLIAEAEAAGMDGINVDLEAIAQSAGPAYVQFVRELSVLCRQRGLVLSVDVPVPMSINRHYDYRELGTVCDYVIVMGYDEHYYGSEEAGSVASLSFEENGITAALEDVPAEKLISAVPFYTRLWDTAADENGTVWVNSRELGMSEAENTVKDWGAEVTWSEETAQHYAEWTTDEGVLCQIWLEDEDSLAQKASLVKKYGLGGIAAWVLTKEKPTVWKVLTENTGLQVKPYEE